MEETIHSCWIWCWQNARSYITRGLEWTNRKQMLSMEANWYIPYKSLSQGTNQDYKNGTKQLTDQMNLSKTWLWGSFRYVQIMVPHAWYCTVTFLCRCCLQMPYAVKSKLLFQYVYTIYGDFSILITLQFLFLLNTNVMKKKQNHVYHLISSMKKYLFL
jgi:hypothetical protein